MKGWNTHQDMENRAYSHILTTLFPEQTRTLPRLIAWGVIFLVNLVVCVFGASEGGLLETRWGQVLTVVAIFGGFWLMGKIWYGIVNALRKRNELG